jgi:hypothetical protein
MSKQQPSLPAGLIEQYERLVGSLPGVERKGATMPYTSLNGHMFSFLTPDGHLALRLSAADRADFLERYGAKLCEQHGRVLAEYVDVPTDLLSRDAELTDYFQRSHSYVASLKPKPTKRK